MAVQAPTLLAEVLAEQPVPQQAFPWKKAGWREMMHDLPAVLQVLNDLPERVDRSLRRKVVLTERADVAGLLRAGVETVRAQGPVEGFRHMNNAGRIKYLGGAFFTKWLYFTSALTSPDDPNAAPILDKQAYDWLEQHAGLNLDIDRTPDYERYIEVLTAWGDTHGRTTVQVEKVIFGLATGRT
jgi:hypothetical protein